MGNKERKNVFSVKGTNESPFNSIKRFAIEREVLKIARYRRKLMAKRALRTAEYVEFQRPIVLYPDGMFLIGESDSDWHPDLWDVRERKKDRPCISGITGDAFRVRGYDRTFVKLDVCEFTYPFSIEPRESTPISPRIIKNLEEEGYTLLGPEFTMLSSSSAENEEVV
jgi:hypothetical protein